MYEYYKQFPTPGSQNWLKGSVAVNITKRGLAPFAFKVCDDIRVEKLKLAIKQHFPDLCGNCSIVEAIPCDPKNNICNAGQCRFHKDRVFRPCLIVKCNDYRNTVTDKIQKGIDIGCICNSCKITEIVSCNPRNKVCNSGRCRFHMDPNTKLNIHTRRCPNNICDTLRNAIQQTHRFGNPSWKNTDARKWCVNAWDIAKCFMPPDGYANVDNENDTDLNGIISVYINSDEFQQYFTADLSFPKNICDKVRDVGKNIRHAPGLEVTDDDLKVWLSDLKALFSDPTFKNDNPLAKDALDQLQQRIKTPIDVMVNDRADEDSHSRHDESNIAIMVMERATPFIDESNIAIMVIERATPFIDESNIAIMVMERATPFIDESNIAIMVMERATPFIDESNIAIMVMERATPFIDE
ncbi:uncharacterized protein LOC128237737 [Mya arenaria]|uniref:uncharacterized protein LOC128237737 n=1 Tax=Mya arenaria TaxID=6604 RepID=UPI0022E721FB|nr:uncharacterized protein LOC128237737 [Mya arenaria]